MRQRLKVCAPTQLWRRCAGTRRYLHAKCHTARVGLWPCGRPGLWLQSRKSRVRGKRSRSRGRGGGSGGGGRSARAWWLCRRQPRVKWRRPLSPKDQWHNLWQFRAELQRRRAIWRPLARQRRPLARQRRAPLQRRRQGRSKRPRKQGQQGSQPQSQVRVFLVAGACAGEGPEADAGAAAGPAAHAGAGVAVTCDGAVALSVADEGVTEALAANAGAAEGSATGTIPAEEQAANQGLVGREGA